MKSTGVCVQVYSSLPIIEQKLKLAGFKFVEKYREIDNYYTHFKKHEIKNMPYSVLISNSILLRTFKKDKTETHFMIYKDKTINSNEEVIKEEKSITKLENMQEAKRIFTVSGLTNWCRMQIDEIKYEKASMLVFIQTVAGLGTFLEITSTDNNGTGELKFKELVYVANSLGLDLGKDFSCKKNYMLFQKNM